MANLLTRASAAIDRGAVRLMERRMIARAPRVPSGDPRARLVEIAELYNGAHDRFFTAPETPSPTRATVAKGPLGTQAIDLAWRSEYAPFAERASELYHRVPENHTAHARWWTSGSGRPTIVLVHGWGGGNHWVTQRRFAVPYWLRHGFDVAAFVLPYHGARAPGTGLGASGRLFPSPTPLRTNEGFGQAVFDLRALALFLRARGASAVGAMGMSLGGYTTALWASVAGARDPGGVDFAVAIIPAVSMAHLMWQHGEHSPARARAVKAGVTLDLLVDAFSVHAPTTRPVRVPSDRLAIIAGRGDRITPPAQAEALAAHWGVGVSWFDGGHLAQVGRGAAIHGVRRQLTGLGFSGREPRL